MDKCLAVLILNWNNWKDTIECLESLKNQTFTNFETVILDNGSTDGSIEKIEDWLNENYKYDELDYAEYDRDSLEEDDNEVTAKYPEKKRFTIIKNGENLGFAKGNNVGIKYALKNNKLKHVFLLNNDTTLAENCFYNMMNEVKANPDIKVATVKICYYVKPEIIWNCGGEIKFPGIRKYYFANENQNNCPGENFKVGLITGCALLVHVDIIRKYGMLTEKFFFGEEDWDFSLRMKSLGIKMFCIPSALVYHKVSASTSALFNKDELFKICVNYINRFIHFKSYYNRVYWCIWRELYLVYIFIFMRRRNIKKKETLSCIKLIKEYSNLHNSVTKNDIENIRRKLNKF